MRRPRTLSTVAATIVTGLVLAACTTGGGAPSDGADRTTAAVVVFQDLSSIDPAQGVDQGSMNAMHNFFEGLYRLDAQNQPVPAGAAALPEVSDDGLVYTIRLNPDARWSDGVPVTAHDYVFAWRRAVGMPNAAEHQRTLGFLQGADQIVAGTADPSTLGVEALDDLTLRVTLRAPAAFFPSLLATPAFFPVPQHFVTAQGAAFATTSDHVLFNGPFVLEGFAGPGIGGDWAYARNELHWDADAVALDRVDVRVIRETSTAVNLFNAGEVDQVVISGPQVQANSGREDFVVDQTATVGFLGYNHGHPVLADQRAREAISLAIDREALTERVLADGSTPATGLVPPGLATSPTGTDFAADAGDALPTDTARAAALWQQVRADHGFTDLTLRLETFDADRIATVAEYLQNALETTLDGLTVTVTTNPVGVFLDKTARQDFDLYLPTWAATFADPSSHLSLFGTGESSNWGGYSNPAFDSLLEAARTTHAADAQARWDDLLAAQQVLLADQGVTPIYFQPSTLLRTPAFRGVEFRTSGPAFFFGNAYFA